MYTNGNFDAHLAALCFLGTLGLTVMLVIATVVLLFRRRAWARYTLLAIVILLAGYAAVLGAFSWASYDRTVKRGDEKFFCALDCHIAYSVQNVERVKSHRRRDLPGRIRGGHVAHPLRRAHHRAVAGKRGAQSPTRRSWSWWTAAGGTSQFPQPGQKAWEKATAKLTFTFRSPAPGRVLRDHLGVRGARRRPNRCGCMPVGTASRSTCSSAMNPARGTERRTSRCSQAGGYAGPHYSPLTKINLGVPFSPGFG